MSANIRYQNSRRTLSTLIVVLSSVGGCVALGPRTYSDEALRQSCEQQFSQRQLEPIEGFWRSEDEYASGTMVIHKTDPGTNNGFPYVGQVVSAAQKIRLPYPMPDRRAALRLKPSLDATKYVGQAALVRWQGAMYGGWVHSYVDCTVQLLDPTTFDMTMHASTPILGGNTQRAYLTGPAEVVEARQAATANAPNSGAVSSQWSATGFLIAPDLVATCNHVVEDEDAALRCFVAGVTVSARVVVRDGDNDLAILRLDASVPEGTPVLPIGRSGDLLQGERIFSLGYPLTDVLGTDLHVHSGTVSSLTGYKGSSSQMQVEMSINPGNSGGPVVADDGRVVGVIRSKLGLRYAVATGNIPDGVAFASKVDMLRMLAESGGLADRLTVPVENPPTLNAEEIVQQFGKAIVRIEATRGEPSPGFRSR